MSETWRPVVGYEGQYEVSDQGRVRSLDRFLVYSWRGKPCERFYPGKMLSLQVGSNGYPHVMLRGVTTNVHRIVTAAFYGPRPDGLVCCHNNGDPTDNRLENLRYDTQSENQHDRRKHGTDPSLFITHCPQGHEYTPENTGSNQGHRRCATCHRKREADRLERKRSDPEWVEHRRQYMREWKARKRLMSA